MEPGVFTALSGGKSLPVASLRLLVPPVQLMAASMLQVLNRRDVMSYWKVAEFVSLVMDLVPELLMFKHRTQLNLGLRARYILELCRTEQIVDQDLILSHLEELKPQQPDQVDMNESGEEAALNFLESIQSLLKDPEERRDFFSEVFPAEYGPQYDSDLQTLFSEFLFRLTQLLPVPDLDQTLCWLGAESSVLEDCVHLVSEPTNLRVLLRHHKDLGHLEQHVPPTSMGECVLSSLAAGSSSRASRAPEEPGRSEPPPGLSDASHAVVFVENVADEIIAVTDYAEVELGPSAEVEEVLGPQSCSEGAEPSVVEGEPLLLLPGQSVREEEVEAEEGGGGGGGGGAALPRLLQAEARLSQGRASGPHDCPDCHKRFRFASSLTAHRVIHTGERPHRCQLCGRCFSFRQSLDRHRHTHRAEGGAGPRAEGRAERRYSCGQCGEAFSSAAARTQHSRTHTTTSFACHLCEQSFSLEQALAQHLQGHTQGLEGRGPDCITVGPPEAERQAEPQDQQSIQPPTPEAPEAPEAPPEASSQVVTVRTSGRKRRPTMKLQVMNLQKRRRSRAEPPESSCSELRPPPFTSAEHSYGSAMVSSKDGDEGSGADGSSFRHSEAAQVQCHINDSHSPEAEEEKRLVRPVPEEEEERPVRPGAEDTARFSCSHCAKSFRFQSVLAAHQRVHSGEQPFLCSLCGQRFSFKQSLERHGRTHAAGRRYACAVCGQSFRSAAAQRQHRDTHMLDGRFLCSQCGRHFTWKSALVRHLKTHGGGGKEAEPEGPEAPDGPFRCPDCGRSFASAAALSRHQRAHQAPRPHGCSCGKSFASRAALTAHQRTHQRERPHACAQCGRSFLYRGGLAAHMQTHRPDAPFSCSFCGKSFKRQRNMRKHERVHTRQDVFRCSLCDKSFVYKATLTRHELTHSGQRPFLCSHCGKGFFSHAELLKHERFHTGHRPFQCQHCGKKFTQSCYLTVHLRYHSGARPYACAQCPKSFLSANRLKRHQRVHSGERPYVCGECGKGFPQAYNLKMHQRTHKLA